MNPNRVLTYYRFSFVRRPMVFQSDVLSDPASDARIKVMIFSCPSRMRSGFYTVFSVFAIALSGSEKRQIYRFVEPTLLTFYGNHTAERIRIKQNTPAIWTFDNSSLVLLGVFPGYIQPHFLFSGRNNCPGVGRSLV